MESLIEKIFVIFALIIGFLFLYAAIKSLITGKIILKNVRCKEERLINDKQDNPFFYYTALLVNFAFSLFWMYLVLTFLATC